jgi:hypothetical protein
VRDPFHQINFIPRSNKDFDNCNNFRLKISTVFVSADAIVGRRLVPQFLMRPVRTNTDQNEAPRVYLHLNHGYQHKHTKPPQVNTKISLHTEHVMNRNRNRNRNSFQFFTISRSDTAELYSLQIWSGTPCPESAIEPYHPTTAARPLS